MRTNLRIVPSLLAAVLLLGCDAEPAATLSAPEAPARQDAELRSGELSQYPDFLSCKGFCGSSAMGFCWCDELCSEYGDCCDDYEPICAPKQACGARAGDTCSDDEYCAYEPDETCGWADAESVCKPRPEFCTREYAPVCGCNSQTYANRCMANAAGQGILNEGPCEPEPEPEPESCGGENGGNCEDGQYCHFEPNSACGTPKGGQCKDKPAACDQAEALVCGCDGETYNNECMANMQGVSAASEGACKPAPKVCGGKGTLTGVCSDNEFCAYGPDNQCGASGVGTCEPRPEACIQIADPVCGCDGKTYGNSCTAASHGVSVAHKGMCKKEKTKCSSSSSCEKGEWCNTIPCLGCDAPPGAQCPAVCYGYCEPIPEAQ